MEQVTISSETTSNTEDYSDDEIFVFQTETPDNVNLIANTSKGNIQILASQCEISTTSSTGKEDPRKAIDISISKMPPKYAECHGGLRHRLRRFRNFIGLSCCKLKKIYTLCENFIYIGPLPVLSLGRASVPGLTGLVGLRGLMGSRDSLSFITQSIFYNCSNYAWNLLISLESITKI